jgi:hypothetical protein
VQIRQAPERLLDRADEHSNFLSLARAGAKVGLASSETLKRRDRSPARLLLYVKYALGTTWYGYDHLFNDYHTGYSKADEVFNFTVGGNTVRGFFITLYTVEGGNLSTSGITASEF